MKFDTKNPRNQKLLLVGICVLGATAYYFFSPSFPFTWQSRQTQLSDLRKQRDDLQAQVDEGKRNADRLEALQQEKAELARRWADLESRLPSEYDEPDFLADITACGQAAHVEFLSFEPKVPVQQQYYSEAPVSVRVEGGYHHLGAFLAELDNMSRIVRIASLRINTHPRADEDRKEGDQEVEKPIPPAVTAELMVSTYFLSTASAAAMATSTATANASPAIASQGQGEPPTQHRVEESGG